MDEANYTSTKVSLSGELEEGIRDKFSINWKQTQYQDLWKPLYSGIAARLKIAEYYKPTYRIIPQTVPEQASYWASVYTSKSSANAIDEYSKASDALVTSKQSLFRFPSFLRSFSV